MKLILRILVAPIIAALTIAVWFCAFLLQCSAFVFGLASLVFTILSIALFLTGAIKNGCIILVLAYLVSPYGFPLLAIRLLGLVQRLRYAIQDRVYG